MVRNSISLNNRAKSFDYSMWSVITNYCLYSAYLMYISWLKHCLDSASDYTMNKPWIRPWSVWMFGSISKKLSLDLASTPRQKIVLVPTSIWSSSTFDVLREWLILMLEAWRSYRWMALIPFPEFSNDLHYYLLTFNFRRFYDSTPRVFSCCEWIRVNW